jgi:hypothetical protein
MDAPSYPSYAGEKLWTVLPAGAIIQQQEAAPSCLASRLAGSPAHNRRAASCYDDIPLRTIGQLSGVGEMFWLKRKTLSGSYLLLSAASRTYLRPP